MENRVALLHHSPPSLYHHNFMVVGTTTVLHNVLVVEMSVANDVEGWL